MTFTWTEPKLSSNVALPAGATITYEIGVYDSRQKLFTGTILSLSHTTFETDALTGVQVGNKVGVRQVITFTNGNVVKSAVKVVTVK